MRATKNFSEKVEGECERPGEREGKSSATQFNASANVQFEY